MRLIKYRICLNGDARICFERIEVSVCTQGAWPSTNVTNIIVPNELEEVVDRFTNFYQERHVGRKLNFRWDKGTAEVVVRFSDKTEKVLVVSTYQMAVLLLFNRANGPILTYQEIIDKTGKISYQHLKLIFEREVRVTL